MKLVFNNDNDIKKFYRHFWIYKLIINWTKLEVQFNNCPNKEECREVINAYNIKNKINRLNFIYDKSCNKLDQLAKINNYCAFCHDQCLIQKNNGAINGCCGNCKYLTKKGCSIQSLTCKLYFCHKIRRIKNCPDINNLILLKLFLSPIQLFKLHFCFFETKSSTIQIIKNKELLWFLITYKTKENNKKDIKY